MRQFRNLRKLNFYQNVALLERYLSLSKKIQELAGKSHGIKLFIMRPFKCAYILGLRFSTS